MAHDDRVRDISSLESLQLNIPVVKPPPPDSRYDKWCGWLEEINGEIITICWYRTVWRTLVDMVQDNPEIPPSHVFGYLAGTYTASQASAVRRQAEVSSRVISLGRLLRELGSYPEVLSRQRYVSLFPAGMAQVIGAGEFAKYFGGATRKHLDRQVVVGDLARLGNVAQRIKVFADKYVAHYDRDREPSTDLPASHELDTAIDVLGELLKKYTLLLKAQDLARVDPIPQYDWLAPFRVPWLGEH